MNYLRSHSAAGKWAAVSAVLFALCAPAFGVLGDNAASVLTDQARLKGTLNSVDRQAYVMHEITASSGAKVREYVSPAGQVFGVAWEGQFPPNFQQLLGPYYQEAQQAATQQQAQESSAQQPPRRRGPVVINTPKIVFVNVGHIHSFHGVAYIPQMVPQGVQASDIR